MPYKVVKFQETPNPNAIKCVLDRSPTDTPRSYFNAAAAESDPLAAALFRIPGVTNVLINDGWITVSKDAKEPWRPLQNAVERVLGEAS